MATKKTGARAPSPQAAPAAAPEAYFKLSADAELQLWRVRQVLTTMADLANANPPAREVALSRDALASTLGLVVDLLDLPTTYVSPTPRRA